MNGANWADSSFVLQDAVLGNSLGSAVNVMTGSVSVTTVAWGGDTDGDGIADNYDSDDDNDGMPDAWEIQNGLNPKVADATGDFDGDGVSNLDEYRYGLNPRLADSNGDGIPDAQEVVNINAAMSVIVNFLLSN